MASLRQLVARETLPPNPPPRVRGTVSGGRTFLTDLLKGETLPELAPGAADTTRPPFFRSLFASDTLPSPETDDRPQHVRAGLRLLLVRERPPHLDPVPADDRPRSFLRFLVTPERLPARQTDPGPSPRNVSTE